MRATRAINTRAQSCFEAISGVIPGNSLRRLFDARVSRALRTLRPSVWRPVAEAVLAEALLVQLSPSRINGLLEDVVLVDGRPILTKTCFILPGDWDLNPVPLEQHQAFDRMKDVAAFEDFRDTESYKHLQRLQQVGELPPRVTKYGDGTIEGYFEFYRDLATRMRANKAVPNFGPSDTDRCVGLAVGRSGKILLHQKGHHRAMLGQFIQCDTMEAKVLVVHPRWVRKLVNSTGLAPANAIVCGITGLANQVEA